MHDDLTAAGIKLEAITSTPGDNKAKIEEKESIEIKFDVQSRAFDPNLEGIYNIDGLGDIWTTKHLEITGQGFTLVQPAVIVLDAMTNNQLIPECTWSWKTMGKKDNKVYENEMMPMEDYGVKFLVSVRPDITDLIPSILERREVKLAAAKPNHVM